MNFIYRLYQDPDRPVKVTHAVLLLYALLVLEIALFLIQSIVFYITHPEQFRLSSILFQSFVYALMFLVARKIAGGKNWARWLLLIGFIFIVITSLCTIQMILDGDAITGISVLSQVIITGMAVNLLFQSSSSRWFSSRTGYLTNLENRVNRRYSSLFDSKPKFLVVATMIYGIVGGLALWGPPALLIFPAEPIGSIKPTSFGQKLMIFVTGSFVAILVGLPLTYFAGRRSLKFGALAIGAMLLLISIVLTTLAGM